MADAMTLLSFGPEGWGDELAAGAWLTIRLALATVPVGLVCGFLLALGRNSENRYLRASCDAFTTVFRGLPELLTLFIVYYGGQLLLQRFVLLFSDIDIQIHQFLAGLIALSLVFMSFASEVFLGALRAVPKGQPEAAMALGLKHRQTMVLVIFPQLMRHALPGLSNLWLSLVKDTSLVSVIALTDLLRQTSIAVGVTKQPFLFYSVACLIYLALSMVSSIGLTGIERWADRGMRGNRR
ncbi:polar amino acid transport system permease protein [Rhodoligotrophos appendicifer]|uniref:ABC transporter permease n=1 Tax=Rhodoligotrophos appendicifer TaxID=987056 RepID=UPI001186A574|nr:ABC transporter permease [Rhodoligotrophos appendicifer]